MKIFTDMEHGANGDFLNLKQAAVLGLDRMARFLGLFWSWNFIHPLTSE